LSFQARFASPSGEELLALARKYQSIAELRRAREAGGDVAPRAVLRALAREFPGALKELDTLPMDDIEHRVRALSLAAKGANVEPWMKWMIAYHATMRAALFVKARVARAPLLANKIVRETAAQATQRSGLPIDEAFVRAVAAPPKGRLNWVVFERLAAELGTTPEAMWRALFPLRRPRRL
jgi:hypothetical protein